MVNMPPGFKNPGLNERAPREIEPSAVARRPDEQQLGEVCSTHTTRGGGLTTELAALPGAACEECSPDFDHSRIEGWVAGVPVVDGVADSGWTDCEGGRVRLVVRVKDSPEQREWVRAMAHGGAYAKEVLG